MKDKTRFTLMVSTAADGSRQPLAVIGKSKKTRCFDLLSHPLPYRNQTKAWFDKVVTKWWIESVFWSDHAIKNENKNCILILDNCSAHKIEYSTFSPHLTVKFLPPNVTSGHQPADMGMIAGLKIGYKGNYLRSLLRIFDEGGGYSRASELRSRQRPGCKGLAFGGKPHILDAMCILDEIWSGRTGKFISDESIQRCWRKADILPLEWNLDIINKVGSASSGRKEK